MKKLMFSPGDQVMIISSGGAYTTLTSRPKGYAYGKSPGNGRVYKFVEYYNGAYILDEALVIESNVTGERFVIANGPAYVRPATENEIQAAGIPTKVIGYRLKPGVSRDTIRLFSNVPWRREDIDFEHDSGVYHQAVRLGVLDKLFDKVYEEPFKPGDWVYVITGGDGAFCANGVVGRIMDAKEILSKLGTGDEVGLSEKGYRGSILKSAKYVIEAAGGYTYGLTQTCKIRKATSQEVHDSNYRELNDVVDGYNILIAANESKISFTKKGDLLSMGYNTFRVPIADLRKIEHQNAMLGEIKINCLAAKIHTIKLGCVSVSMDAIRKIIVAHESLNFVRGSKS